MDKIIFGITTQSSSSSSNSSSEDEEQTEQVKELPVQKHSRRGKVKEEILPVKVETKIEPKIETDIKDSELKDEEKECSEEEPVKRKRGRPLSLEKKCNSSKKVAKEPSLVKKPSPEKIVIEKRPRGRPRKVVDSINTDNTPVKPLKTKVKSSKDNSVTEGNKTTKSVSPLKTKSPIKEAEDENITSTTERLKDPDVVEDETVSSSCQDLVRSVKVRTKPMRKKPSKFYINKVSFFI